MGSRSRFTRREFVPAAAGLFFPAWAGLGRRIADDPPHKRPPAVTPDEVLQVLLEGNRRFTSGQAANPRRKPEDFAKLAEGQNPRAVIVGCADSRVSPDILFDQGIGDLFVVRAAGNVVSGSGAIIRGSVEYAVAELGVSLIMVLGHSQCGAVKAALKHLDAKDSLPGAINELVNSIKPAAAKVKGQAGDGLDNAIKANVEIGVERLKSLEPILAGPVKEGQLKVVGGVYDLRSGKVTVIA